MFSKQFKPSIIVQISFQKLKSKYSAHFDKIINKRKIKNLNLLNYNNKAQTLFFKVKAKMKLPYKNDVNHKIGQDKW